MVSMYSYYTGPHRPNTILRLTPSLIDSLCFNTQFLSLSLEGSHTHAERLVPHFGPFHDFTFSVLEKRT